MYTAYDIYVVHHCRNLHHVLTLDDFISLHPPPPPPPFTDQSCRTHGRPWSKLPTYTVHRSGYSVEDIRAIRATNLENREQYAEETGT